MYFLHEFILEPEDNTMQILFVGIYPGDTLICSNDMYTPMKKRLNYKIKIVTNSSQMCVLDWKE